MNFPYSKSKWLSLSLAALVLTSTAAAAAESTAIPNQPSAESAQQAKPEAKEQVNQNELTVDTAIEMALKNNPDLKALKLDVENANINYRMVDSQLDDLSSEFINSLETAQQKYVNEAKAEMAKKVNELTYQATENKIKLGAQQAYYELLHAQNELALKEQSLKRSEAQLKVAKAAFDVGTRAKTDVLQAEAGVASAEAALAVAKSDVEVARMKLNQFIGSDLSKKWDLTSTDLSIEKKQIDLEESIAKAQEQRVEVKQKEEEIKVAQLNLELIDKYAYLGTYQGRISTRDKEKAQIQLEQTKQDIAVEVSQAYYNLDSALTAINAYKKAKESAAENYRLTNLRYETGLATTLEVIQAEEELSNRENQYQQAVHNYNLALVSFENALGN
ncbi:TolC family protein [Brevibacillus humidisoli]|uniref:TolC family protein n=1 Tax=Brevibacillus humidisoli TaxID=2895522 RepID=UPI001E5DD244|nr:TolC family protein [Brevibacillus humidisoli]UFJ40131.1 TolC family protein [Brevibacillus humidisoli]